MIVQETFSFRKDTLETGYSTNVKVIMPCFLLCDGVTGCLAGICRISLIVDSLNCALVTSYFSILF
jgi:hypothetical protein